MKINKILVLSVSALAVCGTLSAQDLRGVVRDADNQPLVGASVYWEGTTIGASTDAEGAFLLHRVKGYDNLVASYLGFVNDTLHVANGAERIEFALRADGVELEDVRTGERRTLACEGLFVAIGRVPDTGLLRGQVELDAQGYVKADETTRTSLPGVFAVGDVRTKPLRQIVTAAADGAVASKYIEDFLAQME